jgi:hypothetical protein
MTVDTFFTHLFAFLAGAIAASLVIRWAAERFVERLLAAVDETLEQEKATDTATRRVEIEVVDNQVLCYNADTKEFVCQGQDLTQVIERFKQRFPGTYDVKLVPANDETRAWARTQLAKLNETSTSI